MISWVRALPLGIALAVLLGAGAAGAQTIDSDEGSLFGSADEAGEGAADETAPADMSDLFAGDLMTEESGDGAGIAEQDRPAVEIGGSYRFSLTGQAGWPSPADLWAAPLEPDRRSLGVDLGATLFLDARPADDFRVFGKAVISYPFTTADDLEAPRTFSDIVRVTELFSDFQIGESVFLRGGKHTIAWGVGYFFSPADVLNLTAIDPDDPEADREGPVSLRANLPIDFNNLYLYVIADPTADGVKPAVAPKAEVVLGSAEIGIGAYYHPDRVPRAMLTLSTGLADAEVFGELEASLGSDRTFVERDADSPTGLRAVRHANRLFGAATGGLRYTYRPESNDWSATFAGQYLWNGEGYADPTILREPGVRTLLLNRALSPADLTTLPGQHYAAASLNLSLGTRSDWSAGALWITNLSDGSGRVAPSVTFRPADRFSLRAAATLTYGEAGAEMTPLGNRVGASLTATLGSGSF